MSDLVDQTLKQWRQSTFQYGARDCLLSVGDYIVESGGVDALAEFRGTYSTHDEAMGHIAANGGAQGLLERFGLAPVDSDQVKRGDVVLIDPGTGENVVGGICTGDGVVIRAERGTVEIAKRFVKIAFAWKVN